MSENSKEFVDKVINLFKEYKTRSKINKVALKIPYNFNNKQYLMNINIEGPYTIKTKNGVLSSRGMLKFTFFEPFLCFEFENFLQQTPSIQKFLNEKLHPDYFDSLYKGLVEKYDDMLNSIKTIETKDSENEIPSEV